MIGPYFLVRLRARLASRLVRSTVRLIKRKRTAAKKERGK